MNVDELIAKAKESVDTVKPVDQEFLLGDEKVVARFWPVSGTDWRDLAAMHPWREGSQFDQALGYNLDAVLRVYPRVYLVQGDDVQDVSAKWASICELLSAPDLKNLAITLWGMHEFDPQRRMEAAGKASAGGRRKKRTSPASSASRSAS